MINVSHALPIRDGMESTVSATAIPQLGAMAVPLVFMTTVRRVVVARRGMFWLMESVLLLLDFETSSIILDWSIMIYFVDDQQMIPKDLNSFLDASNK